MKNHVLFVRSDEVITIGDMPSDICKDGVIVRRRASHIYPELLLHYAAFWLLRALFGENGRVAAWTRTWRCNWVGVINATGQTMRHRSRRIIVDWEHSQ